MAEFWLLHSPAVLLWGFIQQTDVNAHTDCMSLQVAMLCTCVIKWKALWKQGDVFTSLLQVLWSWSESDVWAESVPGSHPMCLLCRTWSIRSFANGSQELWESGSLFIAVLPHPSHSQSSLLSVQTCARALITILLPMNFGGRDLFPFEEQFGDLSCFEFQALISAVTFCWFWHGYTKAFFCFQHVFSSLWFSLYLLPFSFSCFCYLVFFLWLLFFPLLFWLFFWCFVPFLIVSGISFPLWIPHGLGRDGPAMPSSFLLLLW